MIPRSPCCTPCQRRGFCRVTASCCIECHMTFEEDHAGPYLPPEILDELRRRHDALAEQGYPPEEIREHTAWEEPIFARYVPREVMMQILSDHEQYEAGNLPERDAL